MGINDNLFSIFIRREKYNIVDNMVVGNETCS